MFLHPDFSRRRVFEFPNRGNLLQFVDGPFTGLEGIGPMLSAGDDQDDIFTDRDFSIPVNDEQLENVEILERAFSNLAELFLRHPFIMLECDAAHGVPLGPIARRS